MTPQQVLQDIQTWIIANANNEITADVLRPILEDMVNQPNSITGVLANLSTTDKRTLVDAINEVFIMADNAGGITIHTGTNDPNATPPATFGLGDFYQQTLNGLTVGFYIFNGNSWVLLVKRSTAVFADYDLIGTGYTIQDGDYTLIYQGLSGGSITVPDAQGHTRRIVRIVNKSSASFGVNSTSTVRGSDSTFISSIPAYRVLEIQSNGVEWQQINNPF